MFVAGFIGEPPMNFIESTVKSGAINVGGSVLDLNAVADSEVIKAYEGKEIVLAFRPEAIKLVGKDEPENAYKIACIVELTELLGDNTNVYVDIDGIKTILKVDPHESPEMDQKLSFAIPFKNVYLFDKHTEKRIKLKAK